MMKHEPPPTDPQPKKAIDMTPSERAQALAAIKRGQPPEPMPTDRTAREMNEAERRQWISEHIRRTR